MKPFGFKASSPIGTDRESIPWREAFSDVDEETLPGICLRGAREKKGITQSALSEKTGIPQRHISEMENGKRPIGMRNARIFAKALNVGDKIFL
ncbi:MAG: helix-turn-helix transcriptional regulator [Candidatus Omnitrophota bacterium]